MQYHYWIECILKVVGHFMLGENNVEENNYVFINVHFRFLCFIFHYEWH